MASHPDRELDVHRGDDGSDPDPAPRWLPIDRIEPCPIQPRVNVSMDLIADLARSMTAGRHEPLIEIEPIPDRPGRYQIVCGEQRWRAAQQAGRTRIQVSILPRLSYGDRLRKQYEENRLRAALDLVEEAHAIRVIWNHEGGAGRPSPPPGDRPPPAAVPGRCPQTRGKRSTPSLPSAGGRSGDEAA
jgi:ParB-like nuclease domain